MLNISLEPTLNLKKSIKFDEQIQIKNKYYWLKNQKRNLSSKIQGNEIVQQIISNPLLLTLLRLVFEETGEIPPSRVRLYDAGLQILLTQWDDAKDVGDETYKKMTLNQKEGLLSYLAWMTYVEGEYFVKQQQLEQYITQYIQKISKTKIQPELATRQSKQVLQSLQAQHRLFSEWTPGIYAFSDLSFHEYLAAKAIVEGYAFKKIEQSLKYLVEQLTENRWHQIGVLVAAMLPNADYLLILIKQKIDVFIEKKLSVQPFLTWLEEKSVSINNIYSPAAFRAFCIECILGIETEISCGLDHNLSIDLTANSTKLNDIFLELQKCRFSVSQKQILQQYSELSRVLFDSMEHAGNVTNIIQEELKQTLFLPEKFTSLLEVSA
ncbi:NACHT domain-containing protein [Gloeocapsopsis dulcis]|uniref:Uncharacterized protein n=1 Tax=Gloeocapsopsis dulcis AAB1 = 1H9 TaxID=1433147 RepID=A0A6N8FST2_9CHRO|nr:hypothetical protein [Gloeocapsopsis dulcis]MUL35919.1 hypothetical protein [Gloeocapsopsis dulcis AAB1 = 1H9]WNN87615.1 hypothetical protein P0S91_14955 [Gloeocapsopsis dulcis]